MTKARDIASATPAPSTVSATELGYLDGVSSAIQTQIDSKIGSASAISPTLIDAKGDLIVGSAADTAARLAVGTNNHVLTADSSATNGVKWAAASSGGFTLLSTTSASGSTFTISDISGSYKHLFIQGKNFYGDTNQSKISFRFNSDTGSNYNYVMQKSQGSTYSTGIGNNATSLSSLLDLNNEQTAQEMVQFDMWIYRYTDTDNVAGTCFGKGADFSGGAATRNLNNTFWNYDCSAAISSITIICGGGSFNGGTVYVYGVS